jgi:hypothetical protein
MNERIKQLAVQTHLFTDYEGTPQYKVWGFTDAGLEKFAELIVRECIDTVKKRFMGDLNREDMEIQRCIEDLKKTFRS